MITDLDVKRAMNRLSAVYPDPKDAEGAYHEWRAALRDSRLNLQPIELKDAVTEFIATTEKTYGYPVPGQIVAIVKSRRDSKYYREPEYNHQKATPEDVRKAWEAAGIDLDELKRLHDARKARGNG